MSSHMDKQFHPRLRHGKKGVLVRGIMLTDGKEVST